MFDLHIHTNKSDGKYSVQEIIDFCKKKNINIISITDHDSIDAYTDKEIFNFDGTIITGVEFTSEWKKSIHILGYGFDIENEKIVEACGRIKQYRIEEFLILLKRLKKIGIYISMSKLIQKGKMDIKTLAQCMVEEGYGDNVTDVREKYLGKRSSIFVSKRGIEIVELINTIHSAGGKAILAHPGRLSRNIDEIIQDIIEIIDLGIDGVEVYSPHNSEGLTKCLIDICKKRNLIMTGGSDFHGEKSDSLGIDISPSLINEVSRILKK